MATENITEKDEQRRHSAAHLLAAAVLELWPEVKLTLGPAIENGFYYDFEFPEPITDKDLARIEKRMKRILTTWKEFTHEELAPEKAREFYKDNPYKLELIEEIVKRGEPVTFYTAGNFTDLCRGGHVENPAKELGNFKLLSVAGAYWRGDEKNQMLTRIYGTAFATKEELDEYLNRLSEAKKRDHRKLGKDLDLFTFSSLVGAGLPLFTPRGTLVRRKLEEFVQSLQEPRGYQRVMIPHITKKELYETSGHWDKFKNDLFHVRGVSDTEFVMKPMNCPHHTQIYASRKRSYRELPLRYSEVTTCYRDEQAGELQGLSRVRALTQDDAHVFCTPEQVEEEINKVFSIITEFYQAFSFGLKIRLSLWDPKHPEKYLGTAEVWEKAQGQLRALLQKRQAEFFEATGEAAFYGPKIDFIALDALGREWQLATIQLDFNLPERFDLTFIDNQGKNQRVVMIHRAILGSVERFMAILLEHYAGHLPLWLSPTQVAVLPITEKQNGYANEVREELEKAEIRVVVDERSLSIGKKIREAELMKIPVMLIVGPKEEEAKTVAIRKHGVEEKTENKLEIVRDELRKEIEKRK